MDKQINIAIQKTLNQIGMPHNLKGYSCVVSAIEICIEDRDKIHSVVKCLYPEIAKGYGDTAPRVERAIRHAIEVSWKRGNKKVIDKMFGYSVSCDKGKPTNSEFIAYLCDFISMYGEEIANDTYSF